MTQWWGGTLVNYSLEQALVVDASNLLAPDLVTEWHLTLPDSYLRLFQGRKGVALHLFSWHDLWYFEKYEDTELVRKKNSRKKKETIFIFIFLALNIYLSLLVVQTVQKTYMKIWQTASVILSIRAVCKHVPFQRLQQSSISGTIVGIRVLCLCEGGLTVLSCGIFFSGMVWISFLVFLLTPLFRNY